MAARHDFCCRSCGKVFELVTQRVDGQLSPCCETEAEWIPYVNTEIFKSFWHPHLGHEPVEITSMRHLDRELTARRLSTPATSRRRGSRYERLPQSRDEAQHRS